MTQYEIEIENNSNRIKELERQLSESELKRRYGVVGQDEVRWHNGSVLIKERGRPSSVKTKTLRRSHDKNRRLVLNDPEGPIAFHATNDKTITGNIGENQHIQFEDVHLNIGGGYHVQHGLFIAPVAGVYMFSTSIMATPGGPDIIAAIIKDGKELAKAYAFGGANHDQGSVSVATQLAAGDEVWVASVQRPSVSDYVTKSQDPNIIEVLLKRIEALEHQGDVQQRRIDELDRLLEQYEDKLKQYEGQIQGYCSKLKLFEDQLRNVKDDIRVLYGDNTTKPQVNSGRKTHKGHMVPHFLQTSVRSVKKRGSNKPTRIVPKNVEVPIAFHATNDPAVTTQVGQNQHILFEDVHFNNGNAFHSLHGLFIAPRSGVYLFSASVMGHPASPGMIATIMKNGSKLANIYGMPQQYGQGSVSIVTQLNAGDEVWVASTQLSSAAYYGDYFTSFMGCLITEV